MIGNGELQNHSFDLNERLRKHLREEEVELIMYLLDGIIRSTTKTVRSKD